MNINYAPTKGNLLKLKKSLQLSKEGYELMDRKRTILLRELMELISQAQQIQKKIDATFKSAYQSLEEADIQMGIHYVREIADSIPLENSIQIKSRSIMGTEIPKIDYQKDNLQKVYTFYNTREALDQARLAFEEVKYLTIELARVETSAYRLASSIRKTQKRANALKNISIPNYEAITLQIQNTLEEKEREEFSRLKVIKKQLS